MKSGDRVRHLRLTHFGVGTVSPEQPDIDQGIVYVTWDDLPPGVLSGASLGGEPCGDRTMGHGVRTLRKI